MQTFYPPPCSRPKQAYVSQGQAGEASASSIESTGAPSIRVTAHVDGNNDFAHVGEAPVQSAQSSRESNASSSKGQRIHAPAVVAIAAVPDITMPLPNKAIPSSSGSDGYGRRAMSAMVFGETLDSTFQERLVAFGQDNLPELIRLVEQRCSQFSSLSLATALHRIAALGGHSEYARCSGLCVRIEDVLKVKPEGFRAQSVANMSWAVAKLDWPCQGLLSGLSSASIRQLNRFKSPELSMVLWGLATSSAPASSQQAVLQAVSGEFRRRGAAAFDAQSIATVAYAAGMLLLPSEDQLWMTIGDGSKDRVDEFSDRQVANLVWAFATVVHVDGAVSLCTRVEGHHVKDLAPIDLSLVTWAMAKLCQGEAAFYSEVAAAIIAKERMWKECDTRNIATLIYAMALAGHASDHESAFRMLADAVNDRADDFAVQGLTNAVWGYAISCYVEKPWFAAVAAEVLRREAAEFEPLDVANCLWSFASVAHMNAPLVAKLRNIGSATLNHFSVQNIAITLWSFATLAVRDEAFFERAADLIVQHLGECKSQELNNTLWACATAGIRLPWLFIKADNHALSLGLEKFKTHELSITLWAHGVAGVCNHEFFDAVIAEILEGRGIHSCTPREVSNTAWAYSTIIGRAHSPWLSAIAAFSCERMAEFDMQCIGNMLWSFAHVGVFSEPLFRVACAETARRCTSAVAETALNVAQVLDAISAARFIDVPFLEAATNFFLSFGDAVETRQLVILSNAVHPVCDRISQWKWLEAAMQARIMRPLLASIPKRLQSSGARAFTVGHEEARAAFDACVSMLDLDHLGAHYTANFLREAGLVTDISIVGLLGSHLGSQPWAEHAAQRCVDEHVRITKEGDQTLKSSRQLDKVNKREVLAWVSFEVLLSCPSAQRREQRAEAGRVYAWRQDIEEHDGHYLAAKWLRPVVTKSRHGPNIVGEHDRSGHAERGALLEVATSWLEFAQGAVLEVEGTLRLYVSHFPCISCVSVIAQFARLFPGVRLAVSFTDGRAALCRNLDALLS